MIISHNVLSQFPKKTQDFLSKTNSEKQKRFPVQKWLQQNCQVQWRIQLIHSTPHSSANTHWIFIIAKRYAKGRDKKGKNMWSLKGLTSIHFLKCSYVVPVRTREEEAAREGRCSPRSGHSTGGAGGTTPIPNTTHQLLFHLPVSALSSLNQNLRISDWIIYCFSHLPNNLTVPYGYLKEKNKQKDKNKRH